MGLVSNQQSCKHTCINCHKKLMRSISGKISNLKNFNVANWANYEIKFLVRQKLTMQCTKWHPVKFFAISYMNKNLLWPGFKPGFCSHNAKYLPLYYHSSWSMQSSIILKKHIANVCYG